MFFGLSLDSLPLCPYKNGNSDCHGALAPSEGNWSRRGAGQALPPRAATFIAEASAKACAMGAFSISFVAKKTTVKAIIYTPATVFAHPTFGAP